MAGEKKKEKKEQAQTFEYRVDGREVRANGQRDHGKREAQQLEDDGTVDATCRC